jgi:hypothetical protein
MAILIHRRTASKRYLNIDKFYCQLSQLFSVFRLSKIKIMLFLLIGLNTCRLDGQLLKDTNSINLIKKGIDYVYNFQFSNAARIDKELRRLYPGHPLTYLFKGMITYWENYPLTTTSDARKSFEDDMQKCIDLCDKNTNPSAEAEILLTNLCARGFLLLYYTDNDLSFDVFPIAASTYNCIRQAFNFTSDYTDFFFFTGVYNYFREAYPDAHPIYKTLAFLFPKGSKEKGLEELQTVARNSILLKAESYTFLSEIYLYFENNNMQATFYSKRLHYLYPENPEYLASYIKNLLLMKQYDEAEKEIESPDADLNNTFFKAQVDVFRGILQEKKYYENEKARDYYLKGIRDISAFRSYGEEYAAYAYFGLSRISRLKGDNDSEKTYRKLALKLTDFKNINFD